MDKRKILILASTLAILLAPAAFYAATKYQRSAASAGLGEPDTMATEFLWIPKRAQAGEPDTMATEFLWIPKHVQPTGFRVAGAEQAQ